MPWTERSGCRIWFEVEGQGRPLLMLHGAVGSGETWRIVDYVGALRDEFRLIVVDTHGHGRSPRPAEPASYTYRHHAADAIAVLDELEIERAAAVGFSMGGSTVLALAALHPDRMTAVVAIDSAVDDVGFTDYTLAAPDDWQLPHLVDSAGLSFLIDELERDGRRSLADMLRPEDPTAFRRQLEAWRNPELIGMALTDVRVPMLLFLAEDPARLPLPALPPDARVVTIAGVDHLGVLEATDVVIPALREFVASGGDSKTPKGTAGP